MSERRSAAAGVERALAAIAQREPTIRAWTYVDADGARARAHDIDSADVRPLSGLTFGLKDLVDTAQMPTTYGSVAYRGHYPQRDADIVTALEHAGGCVLGKTVTTEFALMVAGPTQNPHRVGHTPGGSSSGSAAAVASGMVDVGVGTQTYGSLIRPAGYCGVYGFTPTYGRVSMAGVCPLAPSYDKIGWYTRTLDDLQRVYEGLMGEHSEVGRPPRRVGVLAAENWPEVSADVRALMSAASEHVAGAADVVVLHLRDELIDVIRLHHVLASSEIAVTRRDQLDRGVLSAPVAEFVAAGAAISAAERDVAAADLAERGASVLQLFDDVEVLITPSTTSEAPVGLDYTGDPVFCTPWTALGCPALAVPATTGATGLPLGLQLVAAPGRDCRAFCSARALRLEGLRR